MPFHWCHQETMMLMSLIPFIGFFYMKIHIWFNNKFGNKCHAKNCKAEHDHEKND